MTFSDPRIEYQKLIDQNQRFFLTIISSGFSLLIALIANDVNFAVGVPGSGLLIVLCFIWRIRTYLLINKLKAVCEFNKQTDPHFRYFMELEEKIIEGNKVSKGWKGKIDTLIPFVFLLMAFGLLIFFFTINTISKFSQ